MKRGLFPTTRKAVMVALAWCLGMTASADESNDPQQQADPLLVLRSAVEQGQYQHAYAVAQQQLLAYEGDPAFDFYYGFSAAQTGHYQEALFVFERLISAYPDVIRYRLELARAHFYLDNLDGAEREFRRALDSQPPERVVSTVEQFLNRIERRREQNQPQWQAGVSISAGYDSNINAATDEDRIQLLDGQLTAILSEDQRASDSGFYQLRGHAQYLYPLSQRSGIDVRFGASRKDNGLNNDYDLNSAYADVGWRVMRGSHSFGVSGQYRQYHLGGESYQDEIGAEGEWLTAFSERWAWTTTAGLKQQNNQRNSALNLLQGELEFGVNYSHQRFMQQLRGSIRTDIGDDDSLARDSFSASWSFQYAISRQAQWYGMALYQHQQYQNPLSDKNVFAPGVTREEDLTQFALGYSRQLLPTMSMFFQLSLVESSSNVEVYEYQRSLFETGIALSF
ncbi:hypothetical protein CHH28_19590 [Bacterioplanes sanyensis]|uniref:Surface lipoprotein assembly modifier C-terminal domain-containing protein n=1 Tax=Bacterioplanes sanyensis TaxID=1249553 RepID=A0A222FNZ8_9GAMM|nr:tetratricopeptide repeat protein [Bacterioplanes sanyensis]ASP40737.1 hypothetical protein CHH28_19590 [Bacterioplanes sanyensis]